MYSMCRCAQCCSILPLTLPWTAGQPPDLHLIDHQLPTEQQSAGRKQIKGAALVVATVKHGGFGAIKMAIDGEIMEIYIIYIPN